MIWSDVVVLILGILIILFVAVQESQDNIQEAFSGEKSDLFKNQKARGIELFLMRSTFVLVALFIFFVILTLVLRK
ncbi:MAG: preprotein translocase subunit SecG [Acholeplasmataceae bacterium]|jgi:preprotein translocase subunit SecG|nr:preprotein translocase subunit SecG [Acholeplasmataceae bacterium]